MLAARAASAWPRPKTSAKCATVPAPPEAITGMRTAELTAAGVALLSPPTDQAWGHRTLFFRDPDGNHVTISALPAAS